MSYRNRKKNQRDEKKTESTQPERVTDGARVASAGADAGGGTEAEQSPLRLMAWLWGVPLALIIAAVLVKTL